MFWGGMWEGGSCLGTHVRIKDFKIKKIKKKCCFPSDRGHHDTTLGYLGYVAVMSKYSNLGMEECGLAHFKGL